MEETNKLPLKRIEFSLSKFTEVAIPHHLDLLRQHRANIIRYEECGDYVRVRAEQTNARRVTSQLRSLLAELEALRRQVRPEDWLRFDKITQRSRDLTLNAIMDYLGIIESGCKNVAMARGNRRGDTSPLSINRPAAERCVAGSAVSTDSVGVVAHSAAEPETSEDTEPLLQLQVEDQEAALKQREAVLRGWSELQSEVHALHDIWRQVHDSARAQRDQMTTASASVEVAAENVEVARSHLLSAARLRAGAYGAGGAVVGALVGGPVGLVLGAKAGAAAVLAGSALGFFGARVLGSRMQTQIDETEHDKNQ